MTSEEQDELKDAAIAMLVKVACRTSASYEYEIDTLRAALVRLYNYYRDVREDDDSPDSNDWADAWDQARAAIDRTDWRAPDFKAEGGT
jgi:hypothetical protein